MDRQEILALAQQNTAEEIAKFLNKYVAPEKRKEALQAMTPIIKSYNATLDLLPELP